MFSGVFVALVTPFKDGAVDGAALRALIEWQLAEGVDGLVPCGTTGETSTLTDEEYARVIRLTVEVTRKRVPVVAGAGANSTAKAIAQSRIALEAGADALLHVTPFYNKPTQDGLIAHFEAVTRSAKCPIVLYNVPGRTGVNLLPATVGKLAKISNIAGLKDASGSIQQATETLALVPSSFSCLSGEDALNYPLYAIGYRGTISASANVLVGKMAAQWDAFAAGDHATAARLHAELYPLMQALFIETNPIPVKTVLSWLGKCREEFRLPLTKMGEGNRAMLQTVFASCFPLSPGGRGEG